MPVASDNFTNNSTQSYRLSRKDYPAEVEEIWTQESPSQTAGVHMQVSSKPGNGWLEAGPEIDAEINP